MREVLNAMLLAGRVGSAVWIALIAVVLMMGVGAVVYGVEIRAETLAAARTAELEAGKGKHDAVIKKNVSEIQTDEEVPVFLPGLPTQLREISAAIRPVRVRR